LWAGNRAGPGTGSRKNKKKNGGDHCMESATLRRIFWDTRVFPKICGGQGASLGLGRGGNALWAGLPGGGGGGGLLRAAGPKSLGRKNTFRRGQFEAGGKGGPFRARGGTSGSFSGPSPRVRAKGGANRKKKKTSFFSLQKFSSPAPGGAWIRRIGIFAAKKKSCLIFSEQHRPRVQEGCYGGLTDPWGAPPEGGEVKPS